MATKERPFDRNKEFADRARIESPDICRIDAIIELYSTIPNAAMGDHSTNQEQIVFLMGMIAKSLSEINYKLGLIVLEY